jgi:hypothetical protein
MGFDVHLSVTFPCDVNDGVAELAKKHLAEMPKTMTSSWGEPVSIPRECVWFLEELSKRTGPNMGHKGGLSMWGIVGNYTVPEDFVEVLRPFWRELLLGVDDGPLDFEHVIVFFEREQSDQAECFEIWLPDGAKHSGVGVEIKHHRLPFKWDQT